MQEGLIAVVVEAVSFKLSSLLWFKRPHGELKLSESNLGTGQAILIDWWFYFDLNNKQSNEKNL